MADLLNIYHQLLTKHGQQGWWPLITHEGTNPTKTGAHRGYHVGDYSFPHSRSEQFEIAIGAILTQNTAWTSVEKALVKLLPTGALHNPQKLLDLPLIELQDAIRPAGYFNQKSHYLRTMAEFFLTGEESPTRSDLLALKGVGEETADAILLYVFNTASFVVDAYTKRFLNYHGIITDNGKYRDIQALFHEALPQDRKLFQEYHALFVEHGKQFFSSKPYGDDGIVV